MAESAGYPSSAYVDSAILFFGFNFAYHKFVYRHNLHKAKFVSFMLINLFSSHCIVEAFHPGVIRYYTAAYNNTLEYQHRANMNHHLK